MVNQHYGLLGYANVGCGVAVKLSEHAAVVTVAFRGSRITRYKHFSTVTLNYLIAMTL